MKDIRTSTGHTREVRNSLYNNTFIYWLCAYNHQQFASVSSNILLLFYHHSHQSSVSSSPSALKPLNLALDLPLRLLSPLDLTQTWRPRFWFWVMVLYGGLQTPEESSRNHRCRIHFVSSLAWVTLEQCFSNRFPRKLTVPQNTITVSGRNSGIDK